MAKKHTGKRHSPKASTPTSHYGAPRPAHKKHTGLKIFILATMFLLLFSTLGVTVMYLGNNPANSTTSTPEAANYLNEGIKSTGVDEPILEGLGALSGTTTTTGTVHTGTVSTGTASTGSTSKK